MTDNTDLFSTRIEGREITELFNHESKLPSKLWEFTLWLSTLIAAGIAGFIYQETLIEIFDVASLGTTLFADRLNFALGTAGLVFVASLIGMVTGYLWRFFGKLLMRVFYLSPLKSAKSRRFIIRRLFYRLFFGGQISKAFIQLKTPDRNYRRIDTTIKTYFSVFISYIAIFFLVLNNFVPSITNITKISEFYLILLIAFGIAHIILGIYHPVLEISNDASIMTFSRTGAVHEANSKIWTYLDKLFGFAGLLTGYGIVTKEIAVPPFLLDLLSYLPFVNETVIFVALYIVVLLGAFIIVSPIILPSLMIYRRKHSDYVNEFRQACLDAKMPVAKTELRKLNDDEMNEIISFIKIDDQDQ
jgi:hypothetical protein